MAVVSILSTAIGSTPVSSGDRVLQLPWPIPSDGDSLLSPQPSIQAMIHWVGAALAPGGSSSLCGRRETGSATQQATPLPEASQDPRPLVCWEQSQGQNCALERTLLSLTLPPSQGSCGLARKAT